MIIRIDIPSNLHVILDSYCELGGRQIWLDLDHHWIFLDVRLRAGTMVPEAITALAHATRETFPEYRHWSWTLGKPGTL
ncbi:hypothetical protein SAMN00768000_0151 [Sulfobacillus thermosulfidooxidans DSM 9293]|uniref:Uncharacterized protein n=2 Tax=Sulfobacillus thermosulfidooxidans TaxID=28034 RepID=A0A1W1W781_SULTA|nr:hypothetical protein [Sulfobacillus thermosulfidooxidans]PSR22821.1 MAG: hypothetical protein C7B47_16375 [Sulfobacillus thermosulfidooxidans]SMC01910.1 hypothetical protein SAMN00768000_0151 [Sulfobacillus thermosulfidooxidans DSM 9293]